MKLNQLKVNGLMEYRGRKYRILSIDPPVLTIQRYKTDNEAIDINFMDLITDPSFVPSKHLINNIKKNSNAAALDMLTERDLQKVSKRFDIIRPLLVLEKVKEGDFTGYVEFMEHHKHYVKDKELPSDLNIDILSDRIAEKMQKSKRTVLRHYYNFVKARANAYRGEEGLISKSGSGVHQRKDNKIIEICHPQKPDLVLDTIATRLDDAILPIIKEVIEQEYLRVKRPKKREVYDSIANKCTRQKLNPPREITIFKMLDRISPKLKDRMRNGTKAEQKYQDISRGYANEAALYPLHLVAIDHTKLDIDVLDEVGLVVDRPWLTLGIDVYSRQVWCYHLSFDPPSANKVRKAIEHGVLLKRVKERYGTKNEWPVYGIPDVIQFDNGSEFNNYAIKRLVKETLMSNIRFRPIATPRYGGTIERLFGTFNTQFFHRLHGTRKSNVQDLGDYDPEADAALTLEDLDKALVTYIVNIYHNEPHKGLPLDSSTPMTRYYDGLKERGYPEFISEDEETSFRIDLLPTENKPYTRDGVTLGNVQYRIAGLNHLIDKREKKYVVKFDIDDISKIFLLDPTTKEYIEIPAHKPSYETLEGMSRAIYEKIRAKLRKVGKLKRKQFATDKDIREMKDDHDQMLQKMYRKHRRVRKQAAIGNYQVSLNAPLKQPINKGNPSYQELIEMQRQLEEKRRQ
ncbi:Mu transposase C-terminal domain-containing protein [Peribacillus sp. SCS-155]|uniref:Mu transposase C-terminal domain-containing protein n=1 Tax=Peribacillus sedimenti TaxID=3115297 RepID=UPI003906884B